MGCPDVFKSYNSICTVSQGKSHSPRLVLQWMLNSASFLYIHILVTVLCTCERTWTRLAVLKGVLAVEMGMRLEKGSRGSQWW